MLSTIHSAKGLEWDVVHVIHAADGMIPSDMATGDDDEIEEERRLLYVALTRARDALHVVPADALLPPAARPRDPHSYSQLSRFLAPDEVRVDVRGDRPRHRPRARARGRPRRRRPTSTRSSPASGRTDATLGVCPSHDAVLLDLYDTLVWSDW